MLKQIQRKILEGNYVPSLHILNDSLPDDDFSLADALNVILEGELTDIFDDDERGQRYEITGPTLDNYEYAVVCRFTSNGEIVYLITAYAPY